VHQIRSRPGLGPGPRWRSLQRSPDLVGLRGPTSKGAGGKRGKRKEDKGRKEAKKGRFGRGSTAPLTQIPGSAPGYFDFNTATVSLLYEVILLDGRNALFYFKYTVT